MDLYLSDMLLSSKNRRPVLPEKSLKRFENLWETEQMVFGAGETLFVVKQKRAISEHLKPWKQIQNFNFKDFVGPTFIVKYQQSGITWGWQGGAA